MNEQPQIGIVCCCHIEDYLNDIIKKHEKTRPDKEDDRTRHVLSINANSGPVFLTYRDDEAIDTLVELDTAQRPLYHFVAEDGVTHTVWSVEKPEAYVEAFGQKMPGARPSMLLDHMARRPSEIDFINGAIPDAADELGLTAPYNEVMCAIVRSREAEFQGSVNA